ncbi:hypothetical protein IV203_016561 [Nitzschia inconspicua]|uniref:Uncharacterized protein n=1 Tax=Nitzschia inconspicua TaxID=303405 RepID=A0A9K3KQU4_9STRA|nr:hypothetical protein IV203_016561 [Nitzschia inconspicua]
MGRDDNVHHAASTSVGAEGGIYSGTTMMMSQPNQSVVLPVAYGMQPQAAPTMFATPIQHLSHNALSPMMITSGSAPFVPPRRVTLHFGWKSSGPSSSSSNPAKKIRKVLRDPQVTVQDWLYDVMTNEMQHDDLKALLESLDDHFKNSENSSLKFSLGPQRSIVVDMNASATSGKKRKRTSESSIQCIRMELVILTSQVLLSPRDALYDLLENNDEKLEVKATVDGSWISSGATGLACTTPAAKKPKKLIEKNDEEILAATETKKTKADTVDQTDADQKLESTNDKTQLGKSTKKKTHVVKKADRNTGDEHDEKAEKRKRRKSSARNLSEAKKTNSSKLGGAEEVSVDRMSQQNKTIVDNVGDASLPSSFGESDVLVGAKKDEQSIGNHVYKECIEAEFKKYSESNGEGKKELTDTIMNKFIFHRMDKESNGWVPLEVGDSLRSKVQNDLRSRIKKEQLESISGSSAKNGSSKQNGAEARGARKAPLDGPHRQTSKKKSSEKESSKTKVSATQNIDDRLNGNRDADLSDETEVDGQDIRIEDDNANEVKDVPEANNNSEAEKETSEQKPSPFEKKKSTVDRRSNIQTTANDTGAGLEGESTENSTPSEKENAVDGNLKTMFDEKESFNQASSSSSSSSDTSSSSDSDSSNDSSDDSSTDSKIAKVSTCTPHELKKPSKLAAAKVESTETTPAAPKQNPQRNETQKNVAANKGTKKKPLLDPNKKFQFPTSKKRVPDGPRKNDTGEIPATSKTSIKHTSTSKSLKRAKAPMSEKMIKEIVYQGPPKTNPSNLEGGAWPQGWEQVTKARSSDGATDNVWHTPGGKTLRSMRAVRKFMIALTIANGDEEKAFKTFKDVELKSYSTEMPSVTKVDIKESDKKSSVKKTAAM